MEYLLAISHDTDSVSQIISFIHKVSGQDDDFFALVLLEHVPNMTSGRCVHSGSRLVEINQLRVSNKGNGY